MGASIAFQLGARDVVLADRRGIAAGATSKAMGGVRQQFSTAAEVRLAQASVRFFEELGSPLFEQVGYLFLATTEAGLAELEERRELQAELGVPAERVDPSFVDGLRTDDVLGAVNCATDGVADPPAVTRELVRRALKLGIEVREGTDAATRIERSWAGLYDMPPDAHPILGEVADGVYAACGFSGHGFMQSPAVGRALAEEILGETPGLDLSPYRLERFESCASFPEELVL